MFFARLLRVFCAFFAAKAAHDTTVFVSCVAVVVVAPSAAAVADAVAQLYTVVFLDFLVFWFSNEWTSLTPQFP